MAVDPGNPVDAQGGRGPEDAAPSETGGGEAGEELGGRVYAQLRAIAQRQMQGERGGHTLTATALVHEAYLKLSPAGMSAAEEARFYHAAAQAMRRILIDHARRRGAAKRGGGRRRLEGIASVLDLASEDRLEESVALEQALSRLEREDADAAAVVRLRFFAGLSGEASARVLGISARQVDREWAYARAFLAREMSGEEGGEG